MCKKSRCYLFYFFLIVVLSSLAFVVYKYSTNKAPVPEINMARESLGAARKKLAGHYAEDTLKEADALFNRSLKEWEIQNGKFFLFRDYELTRDLAVKSHEKSASAIHESTNAKDKIRNDVQSRLKRLKSDIEHFETFYKNLALNKRTIQDFNQGKSRFLEAQIEFKNNSFLEASKLASKSAEYMMQAEKSARTLLAEYYGNYPQWKKNTELAYSLSKKGQTVILVDKIQSTLVLLKEGKDYRTFKVEFGKNWMGDKNHEGDKATPEGVYKIVEKKSNARTKYYKALLINYPNQEDQKKYNRMIKNGEISKKNGIGGLIEIHGEGGKGINWTDGCVAVENTEMDIVYKNCSVNTPVIIVGSTLPLEKYLN